MDKYIEDFGRIKSANEMRDYADFLAFETALKIFNEEADEKLKIFKNRYTHVVSLKDYSLIEISAFDDYMLAVLEDFKVEYGVLGNELEPVKEVIDYVRKSVFLGFNLKDLDVENEAVQNSWIDYVKYMYLNDNHNLTKKSFEDFETAMESLFIGFDF